MAHGRGRRLFGRCSWLFLLALGFDALGLCLILIGIFVNLQLNGRSFGEFLIYSGGIMLFFSLLWWLTWYSFNLEVSIEDLLKDPSLHSKKSNLVQLARKFSERFSKRSRRKVESVAVGVPPSIASLTSIPSPVATSVFINSSFCSHVGSEGTVMELSAASSMNGHVVERLV
ncbi:hypothetical protein GDO78_023050 [Eleutherodactylus coqui]|uniref:Transmembrane protein 238 n=1 Tax=Eleutherodactylus coqui TaxID=57060 RepID=A0A8J6BHV0_ELECQ|nr:hypothetical protein GDO78_023050 [Eleutherodactylus coqui]